VKKLELKSLTLAFVGIAGFASSASALPILGGTDQGSGLWTGSDGAGRIASAQFADASTSTYNAFSITLSNLAAPGDSRQPNEMLVGLIFDFNTNPGPGIIDPSSDAFSVNVTGNILPSGSATYGTNLDGEFAYQDNVFGATGGIGSYVISSSAYDPLGINPVIDPTVAYHPVSTNGASYGIAAAGANPVNSVKAWIDGSATIYFQTTGLFNFSDLRSVNFMYGTDFYATVPEPYTLSMLGAGLVVVGFAARRRRRPA